ncbi:MAG: hypothetical protein RR330_00865 [Alistipes sp.]
MKALRYVLFLVITFLVVACVKECEPEMATPVSSSNPNVVPLDQALANLESVLNDIDAASTRGGKHRIITYNKPIQ